MFATRIVDSRSKTMTHLSQIRFSGLLSRVAKARPFLGLITLGVGLLCGSQASAQSYTSLRLSEQNNEFYYALNNFGQVAGSRVDNFNNTYALITGPNGQGPNTLIMMQGSVLGSAINAHGQLVGTVDMSGTGLDLQAFVTGPQGGSPQFLGGLGGDITSPLGINRAGLVVGRARDSDNKFQAVQWLPNSSTAERLATLGGSTSTAQAVNDQWLIVGTSGRSDGSNHAVIWGLNGAAITDLGTLGGRNSSALAINTWAQVVGGSRVADGSLHAYITGPGAAGMTDLGTLGWAHSRASFINDSGVVAGTLMTGTDAASYFESHVFITGANGQGMVDLNSLVSVGEGLYLNDVWGLNDAGQLLVSDQNGLSYLLTPVPEAASSAMLLAGLLMLALLARQRRGDTKAPALKSTQA